LGTTFKENVSDVRNSKVAELVHELMAFSVQVDVVDPLADQEALLADYQIALSQNPSGKYDAIMLAVAHSPFLEISNSLLQSWANMPALLVDLKGLWKNQSKGFDYWSL
jgi:UDP-N-acetyl-D-galactosamine dehydrogenase